MKEKDKKKRPTAAERQAKWEQDEENTNHSAALIEDFKNTQKARFDLLEQLQDRSYKSYKWSSGLADKLEDLVKVLLFSGMLQVVLNGRGLKIVDDEDFE